MSSDGISFLNIHKIHILYSWACIRYEPKTYLMRIQDKVKLNIEQK